MIRSIVLNPNDNVATLIDPGAANAECELRGEGKGKLKLGNALPYGHKIAIEDIGAGDDIVKYGTVIGRATAPIKAREHAHVHNPESRRGRGDEARQA